MSVATPKHQAKAPINFDIIMVCRKSQSEPVNADTVRDLTLTGALERAEAQIARLRTSGWKLSRNDIGVMVMAQVVAEISRRPGTDATEQILDEIESTIVEAINRLHEQRFEGIGP